MAVKVRLDEQRDLTGRAAEFYPACDHCGEAIDEERPGNCEFVEEEGAAVHFLHMDCTKAFRAEKTEDALCAATGCLHQDEMTFQHRRAGYSPRARRKPDAGRK